MKIPKNHSNWLLIGVILVLSSGSPFFPHRGWRAKVAALQIRGHARSTRPLYYDSDNKQETSRDNEFTVCDTGRRDVVYSKLPPLLAAAAANLMVGTVPPSCWAKSGDELVSSPPSLSTTITATPASNLPTAPVEALVPAVRKRRLLSKSLELSKTLVSRQSCQDESDSDCETFVIAELRRILEPPGATISKKPALTRTKRYGPVDPALLESDRLSGISIRAAMNMYTSNLRFGETYTWNASKEEKRRYIRQYDQLPDVKQVIAADLDLRDLYRNLVQTKVDDSQAELYSKQMDATELQSLLQEANDALNQWFALISEQDIVIAEQAASGS